MTFCHYVGGFAPISALFCNFCPSHKGLSVSIIYVESTVSCHYFVGESPWNSIAYSFEFNFLYRSGLFFSVLSYSKINMFLDVSDRVPHFQAIPWNYFATC